MKSNKIAFLKKVFSVGLILASSLARADFGVTTWNMKHLGREKQNLDDVALLLAGRDPDGQFVAGTFRNGPDLILLQEVDPGDEGADEDGQAAPKKSRKSGKRTSTEAVRTLQEKLKQYTQGEKYCAGFSITHHDPDYDTHERYAMLWKLSTIHYITMKGVEMHDCDEKTAVNLPTAENPDLKEKMKRPPAIGRFIEVETKKKFIAATVHLVPNDKRRGKDPREEVPYLFLNVMTFATDGFDGRNLPKLITGDFNLNSGTPPFREWLDETAKTEFREPSKYPVLTNQSVFKAALSSSDKTSLQSKKRDFSAAYDNVFLQDMSFVNKANVPNPYLVFKDRTDAQIFDEISDHAPVFAKVHIDD